MPKPTSNIAAALRASQETVESSEVQSVEATDKQRLRHIQTAHPISLDAVSLCLGLTVLALLCNSLAPLPYMVSHSCICAGFSTAQIVAKDLKNKQKQRSVYSGHSKHCAVIEQDEPFHVGQTKQYCQGHFYEWDPKITTFPGLYLLGSLTGYAVHASINFVAPESTFAKVQMPDLQQLSCIAKHKSICCVMLPCFAIQHTKQKETLQVSSAAFLSFCKQHSQLNQIYYELSIIHPLQAELCNTTILRTINIAFATACYVISYYTYRKLHPRTQSEFASQMVITFVYKLQL